MGERRRGAPGDPAPYGTDRGRTGRQGRPFPETAVLASLPEGVVTLGPEGTVIDLNPAAERLLGWTSEELRGLPFHGTVCRQDGDSPEGCPILQVLDTGLPQEGLEEELVRADGTPFAVAYRAAPLRVDGALQGAVLVLRDATKEAWAARRLAESEERYRSLFDNNPLGAYSLDLQGTVTAVNAAKMALHGRPVEEVVGHNFLPFIAPEDRPRTLDAFRRVVSGEVVTADLGLLHRDGHVIPLHVIAFPMTVEGRIVGAYGLMRDATVEREREEQARKLVAFLENTTDAFVALDREWRYTYVNREAERILQIRREEVLGVDCWEVFPQNVGSPFWHQYQKARRENVPVHFEEHYAELGVWYEVHAYPSEDGLAIFFRDVTERRRREEALRASEEKLRAILHAVPSGVAITDHEGRFTYVNETARRIMRDPDGHMVGLHTADAVFDLRRHDGTPFPVEELPVIRVLATGEACHDAQLSVRRSDGSRLLISASAAPFRDATGNLAGCVIAFSDITARKEAEAALEESQRTLRTLFSNLPGMAYRCGNEPEWTLEFASEGGEALTGYALEELVGGSARRYADLILEDDREHVWETVQGALAAGRPFEIMYRIRTRSGEVRWVWEKGRAVEDARGEKAAFIEGFITDVTEIKEAQEALKRLTRELEDRVSRRTRELAAAVSNLRVANEELESFSYSVSHDLRAPLRAIDYLSQTVLEDHEEEMSVDGLRQLQMLRRETRRMGQLIDDLLNLSRASRGELRHARVDLGALARGVVEELRGREPARQVQVDIEPGLEAEGDPRLLGVVLENLLGNAWKYTRREQQPRIVVGSQPGDHGERVFFVRDNGAGFDMAKADRLFKPFQRLHSPREFEGTGVGLATVSRIIQRHGGRVWAEGEEDVGATFFFTLAPPSREDPPSETDRDTFGHLPGSG